MAARSHSLGLGLVISDPFEGLFLRYAKTDLERIFRENMLKQNFEESPQIRARTWVP